MAFKHVLVLIALIATVSVASQTHVAYGHGCQAQGGCCNVGSACIDISANSPIYITFVVVGLGGAMLFKFYGGFEQRTKIGAIFNIFN